MVSLRNVAKVYEPKTTKNISDLDEVSTEIEVYDASFEKDGKLIEYKAAKIDGEEYRIPDSVLKQLKAILEKKPSMTKFCVSKEGEGMATKYQVIQLD